MRRWFYNMPYNVYENKKDGVTELAFFGYRHKI